MQPAGPALPKLNSLGLQNISAPVLRQGYVAGKFLFHFMPFGFQCRAVGQDFGLV